MNCERQNEMAEEKFSFDVEGQENTRMFCIRKPEGTVFFGFVVHLFGFSENILWPQDLENALRKQAEAASDF